MARKTYSVSDLRDKVNNMLAHSHANSADLNGSLAVAEVGSRLALCTLLESVLHDTDNYRGFRYLDGAENVRLDNYDESARHYF